ncbi:pyrroline-5-carboxylate reductase dimerization domain-containing protein [Methanospirillum lacunae]|uniref:Pyrroline-5-carboxylate reductase n=1 Tax=Methanospirillum lacunae TaxID=668570 RepID=A0A2V2N3B9_9EURY|nr:pyrroline-5-carboxylate reductase dimerization domain-containing protein [Methanospirillum lacunae]PWR74684.1 pyrroline-5-carboxylate reductase [Methanospirillum lacunae]
MKSIGFIGYGQMNCMLVEGFLQTSALNPEDIIISTRTREKVNPLLERYPEIRIATCNSEVAEVADLIIIGVKPLEVTGILKEISGVRDNEIHIISLAACVSTDLLAQIHPGKITRILPSVCSTVGEGISLCYHHHRVTPDCARYVEELFTAISTVKLVKEELFEPAGDMMSCAPAFLSRFFLEFALAGSRHSTLTLNECLEMVVSTAFGTALMLQEGMEPEDLIRRVATPGGITEEGVKILERDLPAVFDRLFETTLSKYDLVKTRVSETFN